MRSVGLQWFDSQWNYPYASGWTPLADIQNQEESSDNQTNANPDEDHRQKPTGDAPTIEDIGPEDEDQPKNRNETNQNNHENNNKKSDKKDHLPPEMILLIDDIPFEQYIKENNIHIDEHEVMRKHVLTLTRQFNHRLKMFMKHIVMGKNSEMKVKYWSYRVEFQGRGAPHAHGVLWLDLDAKLRDDDGKIIYELDENNDPKPIYLYPGVKTAMQKIKDDDPLTDEDLDNLTTFTDTFVKVDLHIPEIQHIVKAVNIHHHTKTCGKRGNTKCRFNKPHFPSLKTIISRPYKFMKKLDKKGKELSDNQKKELYNTYQNKLKKVKDLLEDDDEMEKLESLSSEAQIEKLCEMAKISVTDYEEALKWSYKQYKVTLKRRIEERFVNSYNPEWIRAWNGNMDLQICLDFYGVITYITEYVTKGDVELTSSLILAAKNCKSLPTIEKMKKIARTFSSSRSIGESEMYYKLLTSELHLTDSNVTTKYVPACFPEHRSHFMQVIQDEDIHKYDSSALVEIQGKTRKYVSAPNIIDKYIRRPQKLENMSLMQFSKMYDSISILPAKAGKLQEGVSLLRAEPSEDIEKHYDRHRDYDRILIHHENGPNMTVDEYSELLLPKYIELSNCKPGDAKYLRL